MTATDLAIRLLTRADLPTVLALNNDAVPNVSELDGGALAKLVDLAAVAVVAETAEGTVVGFVLALPPGAAYESLNYRWFAERYADFRYVDRIVVDPATRGVGVGAALYRAVVDDAVGAQAPRVTCEVNLIPPNPGSMRFHQRLGFVEVGTQYVDGGAKQVAMLAMEL